MMTHHRLVLTDSCIVLTVLVLLTLHLQNAEGGLMHICNFQQRRPHPRGLCGRRLPVVLAGMCRQLTLLMSDDSGSKGKRKRDVDDVKEEQLSAQTQSSLDDVAPGLRELTAEEVATYGDKLKDIALERKWAVSYLSKRQPGGDIVCECCYNHCSALELLQYCELPGM